MNTRHEHKRDQSIYQIQQVALALFAERGYEKTTIRLIAKEANIALGLLYNYFPSKEALLKTIYSRYRQTINEALEPDGDNIKQNDLENYIRQTFRLLKQNRQFWKLMHGIRLQSEIIKNLEEEARKENDKIYKRVEEYLVDADVPFPALEAKLLFATLDGITQHYLLQDNFPLDDIANLLILKYREQQNRNNFT